MNKDELIKYHFEKAIQTVDTAFAIIELGDYSSSVSRSYYSVYHIVECLFLSHNLSSKTHQGKQIIFSKEFILKGVFPNEVGKIYSQILNDRMLGDYGDTETLTEEDALNSHQNAKYFIETISNYLKKNNLL